MCNFPQNRFSEGGANIRVLYHLNSDQRVIFALYGFSPSSSSQIIKRGRKKEHQPCGREMARTAHRPCFRGMLIYVQVSNMFRELKPQASRPRAKCGKNRPCAWEAKLPNLTKSLAHCQAGRTGQEGMRVGLRELLDKEKKIVYSAGLSGSIILLGPSLRLCTATGSRRETET